MTEGTQNEREKSAEKAVEEFMRDFRISCFVRKYPWTYAKTYADRAPHEYYVKQELDQKGQKEFVWFVKLIRKIGFKAKFWGEEHVYLEFDGKYYWTMGEPIKETYILNRCDAAEYTVEDGEMRWKNG